MREVWISECCSCRDSWGWRPDEVPRVPIFVGIAELERPVQPIGCEGEGEVDLASEVSTAFDGLGDGGSVSGMMAPLGDYPNRMEVPLRGAWPGAFVDQ